MSSKYLGIARDKSKKDDGAFTAEQQKILDELQETLDAVPAAEIDPVKIYARFNNPPKRNDG